MTVPHEIALVNRALIPEIRKDIPEALILAVLADYQGEKPEKVIGTIIEKLKKVSGDETKLKRYITQLAGLSGLRNLEKNVLKQFYLTKLFNLCDGKAEDKVETSKTDGVVAAKNSP